MRAEWPEEKPDNSSRGLAPMRAEWPEKKPDTSSRGVEMNQPSGLRNMLRAVAGALPIVPRSDQLPKRTVTIEELPIDQTNVAAYAAVTGLRYGNNVPLTYPFALTFPSIMSLVSGFDFPFSAMGSVHTENQIEQYRPIAVTDTVGVQVHAEKLRG